MSDQWSIEILSGPRGAVYFLPDVRGAKIGDPLQAQVGDVVTWSNRTDMDLDLQAVDKTKFPNFDRSIPAGEQSDLFLITSLEFDYCCKTPVKCHKIVEAAIG